MLYIKADFHIHAIGESVFISNTTRLVEDIIHTALQLGLNCVAITDHNDVQPALYAQKLVADNMLPITVIPGCEVNTEEAHLLALNVHEQIPTNKSFAETTDIIHSLGGLAVAPHPDYKLLANGLPLDGFEWYNGFCGSFEFNDIPLARFAGSDAHSSVELLRDSCWTLGETENPSIEAILDAIKMKRTMPIRGKGWEYRQR